VRCSEMRSCERTLGVDTDSRHRVHGRLRDVLDHDGNVVVPNSDRLVVRRGDESTVVVDKVDRVDGSEVLVVLLRDVARGHIVLLEERIVSEAQDGADEGLTWMIFLSDIPARKTFCFSG
jgi:hypothetical protein